MRSLPKNRKQFAQLRASEQLLACCMATCEPGLGFAYRFQPMQAGHAGMALRPRYRAHQRLLREHSVAALEGPSCEDTSASPRSRISHSDAISVRKEDDLVMQNA